MSDEGTPNSFQEISDEGTPNSFHVFVRDHHVIIVEYYGGIGNRLYSGASPESGRPPL
jgi:hypothetical protein